MSWQALEDGNMELARYGLSRIGSRVAYLATIRKDGSPRVHPVTPFLADGHLLIGMDADSPKGYDLLRDGRYAVHCSVEDDEGGEGEFIISGRARRTENLELRNLATEYAPYDFLERIVLFVLEIERALSTIYSEEGTMRDRWQNS